MTNQGHGSPKIGQGNQEKGKEIKLETLSQ
jgi:hypothetical protein